MIPESAGTDPGDTDTPETRLADAIVALGDAMKGATGQEVRLYTSGNIRPDSAAFLTITILPYVTETEIAPIEPEPARVADDSTTAPAKPCNGCS